MSWKDIIEIKDPREVEFKKWWDNGGDHPYGNEDIVDEKRAKKAFYECIETFKPFFDEYFKKWLEAENTFHPFKDRRGIEDNVNKMKCKEAFLAAIKCLIK